VDVDQGLPCPFNAIINTAVRRKLDEILAAQ
jgi:hypothetical protein